ncbi:hypothetical protein EPA93_05540 [Ktedonosporobacter rubrisoli]|uniref:HTH luxR-type domain-containing protein n=1 Tax=Ktedonosporobacter rubrisoli TaxID=2509675 RepID=A0A4P6JK27_KTERU|nr:LuxR C-terminal-related transcriptional regulator [Ktedonosporobacter rubrisoli]QBD75494.1 hypothetical protein EPA93_05540 [Ktedonosporobacter rubrisoli]
MLEKKPLLTPKFFMPVLPEQALPRSHVLKLLAPSLHRKLTLISAPAGFGKTTLLTLWLHSLTQAGQGAPHVVWISLDQSDDNAYRFWEYILTALVPLTGRAALQALLTLPPPPLEEVLTILINTLAELPEPIVLALDDYHMVSDSAIHAHLIFFLEHLPPCMHLVLATRYDPPLALARWRGKGQLVEIHAEQLRCSREEMATFLAQIMGHALSEEAIALIAERTEGWLVGLQLLALMLQHQPDATQVLQELSGSQRPLLQYLTEEVLDEQPAELRTFLLRTAILERLSAPLCAAVMQNSVAACQDMLEQLERRHLFIVALDTQGRWYRYHHLFAEALRHLLARDMEEAKLWQLYQQVSDCYEQQGMLAEAIEAAFAAQDFARAARLLVKCCQTAPFRSHYLTLRRWLERLPRPWLETSAELCQSYVLVQVLTGQQGNEKLLQLAERHWKSLNQPQRLGQVQVIRALLALKQGGDISSCVALAQQALDYLPREDVYWRSHCVQYISEHLLFNGRGEEVRSMLEEAYALAQQANNLYSMFKIRLHQGSLLQVQGKLHQAASYFHELDTTKELAEFPYLAYVRLLRLVSLYYEWNELARAEFYLARAESLLPHLEKVLLLPQCALYRALIAFARGDYALAEDYCFQAERIAQNSGFVLAVEEVLLYQTRLYLARTDLSSALACLSKASLSPELLLNEMPANEHLDWYSCLIRLLLAQGRNDQARSLAERQALLQKENFASYIEFQLLEILALQAQGQQQSALEELRRLLVRCRPEGYIRIFVDEGKDLVPLLQALSSHEREPFMLSYIERLLQAFAPIQPSAEIAGLAANKQPVCASTSLPESDLLSEREREVLHLLARGASNHEIAEALVITYNTTKRHVHNILEKLQASNRTQAVAQARKLGLLSTE